MPTSNPTAQERANILILGASYAGISTAHYLLKHVIPKLGNPDRYCVTLIAPSAEVLCRPACPRAMISDTAFDQDKLFKGVEQCFATYSPKSWSFLQGKARAVDFAKRTVVVDLDAQRQEIKFHALVIATGASTPSPLLGLNGSAEELRRAWQDIRMRVPTAKSIVIAGGGPAGVETAAELAEHSNIHPRPDGTKPEITLITSAAHLLPNLRHSIADQAAKQLVKLDVSVRMNEKVNHTEGSSPTICHLSSGKTIEADIYIPATGCVPNTKFLPDDVLSADDRVITDGHLRVPAAGERIYALGDCSTFARPAIHNILSAVPVLCANICNDLVKAEGGEGRKEREFKEDKRETQMVLLGKRKAVGAAKGWWLPDWVVRMIKRDYWLWTVGRLWSGEQWDKE